jgi:pyruvate kinase
LPSILLVLVLLLSPATKLVCALGPSSHSVEVLEAMLNAGMVGARIDLTWGGLDFHRESLRALNVSSTPGR